MTELNQNQLKGAAYENQILELLRRDKPAYLWKYAPETILIENGIIGSHNTARLKRKAELCDSSENTQENPLENLLRDTGVDLIVMETETECSLVQCKNGYKNGITMHDLAGFMCWMATMNNKLGYVYYTDKLSLNIRALPSQNRIKYIREPFNPEFMPSGSSASDAIVIPATEPGLQQVFIPDPAKLEYQHQARDLAVEYYRNHDNGVLAMPCGTGKTYTAFLIAHSFKQVVILSPLKQFAKQNMDRFVEYGFPRANTLLVDSDGCRDITRVREFITGNSAGGFLISATYDSADVISNVLADIQNPAQTLFICDEFHNLSVANVNDETDPMNKILVATGFKKLFMSATPRIFELESAGETGDYVVGDTIYDMSFKYAIDRGFITDYRIWLPSIREDISDLRLDIHKELGVKDVLGSENIIYSKVVYLFSCLVNTGVQKCIIYCADTEEIRALMETMNKLNEYYSLDLHMDKITSANSASSRTQILADFAGSSRVELLFSVRILDECIDIPSCDSIYITYPTKSKIRTIQRLMRCTRTISGNKYKVGQVFIWCSEYNSILETLGGIKEIDSSFAEKVMINEVGQFRERGNSDARTAINDDSSEVKKLIIGVKEYRMVSWFEKLEMVKRYIDENGKRPSNKSDDKKTKYLGQWISTQFRNYKDKTQIMAEPSVYTIWSQFMNSSNYSEYFWDKNTLWHKNLNDVIDYMNKYKKRPSKKSEDETIKALGIWISNQIINHTEILGCMKNPEIYNTWLEFTNNPIYSEYLSDNKTYWFSNLSAVKKYIDETKKKPMITNDEPNIKRLGIWILTQLKYYESKKYIMSDADVYAAWTDFMNSDTYSIYFRDNESVWRNNLQDAKNYIDEHGKRPPKKNTNSEFEQRLGNWITNQITKHKTRSQIMKKDEYYLEWSSFVNDTKYSKYFVDSTTEWHNNLAAVKQYIDNNNKRPFSENKYSDIFYLSKWLSHQMTNYKKRTAIMKNDDVFNTWMAFITHPDYAKYFTNNKTT